MKKIIILMVLLLAITGNTVAQQKANLEAYTGNNAWLLSVSPKAILDKDAYSGDQKFSFGGDLRVTRYKKGVSYFAEVGWANENAEFSLGAGVNLTKSKNAKFIPRIELSAGFQNQLMGYQYVATDGKEIPSTITQKFDDFKFRPKATLGLVGELRIADRSSIEMTFFAMYLPFNGNFIEPSASTTIGGEPAKNGLSKIELKADKFQVGASIAWKFRIK